MGHQTRLGIFLLTYRFKITFPSTPTHIPPLIKSLFYESQERLVEKFPFNSQKLHNQPKVAYLPKSNRVG